MLIRGSLHWIKIVARGTLEPKVLTIFSASVFATINETMYYKNVLYVLVHSMSMAECRTDSKPNTLEFLQPTLTLAH